MNELTKVFISHQKQCDQTEIEKLFAYLKDVGFDVQDGTLAEAEFNLVIAQSASYVCILEQHTHKSQEIAREITTAAMNGKRIFAIFCPSISGELVLPPALEEYATGITEWNPEKLAEGLSGKDIGFSNQQGLPSKQQRSTTPPSCK